MRITFDHVLALELLMERFKEEEREEREQHGEVVERVVFLRFAMKYVRELHAGIKKELVAKKRKRLAARPALYTGGPAEERQELRRMGFK